MQKKLQIVKLSSRIALGLVWIYEGLIPKLLFLRSDEVDLVRRSGLFWRSPALTLALLGCAQIAVGLWLLAGLCERFAVTVATLWMGILIILVVAGNPWMLTDPYGALAKDFCLVACALTVWLLSTPVAREPRNPLTSARV